MRPTLFLCGPYTGHEEDAEDRFTDAQLELELSDYRMVNPLDECTDANVDPEDWNACMRVTIPAMLGCTGVALLDGWENSRGAVIEKVLAEDLGMPVATVSEWQRGCVQ